MVSIAATGATCDVSKVWRRPDSAHKRRLDVDWKKLEYFTLESHSGAPSREPRWARPCPGTQKEIPVPYHP